MHGVPSLHPLPPRGRRRLAHEALRPPPGKAVSKTTPPGIAAHSQRGMSHWGSGSNQSHEDILFDLEITWSHHGDKDEHRRVKCRKEREKALGLPLRKLNVL